MTPLVRDESTQTGFLTTSRMPYGLLDLQGRFLADQCSEERGIYICDIDAGTKLSNFGDILRFIVDDDELQRASDIEGELRRPLKDAVIERHCKVNKMQDVLRKVTETDTKLENVVRG